MLEVALTCLATAIYFEARGEPLLGQVAVGHVIMNRVYDPYFPNDVCSVVQQGKTYSWKPDYPIKNQCQFSFYCDGKSDRPKDLEAYETARLIAFGVYLNKIDDPTNGAVFYHADYVEPHWAKQKYRIKQISTHIFYKWSD